MYLLLVTKFTVFLGLLLWKHASTVLLCSHFLSFSIIPSVPVSFSCRLPHENNAHIFLLSCSYHIASQFHTPVFNPSIAQMSFLIILFCFHLSSL